MREIKFRAWDIEAEEYLPISDGKCDGVIGISADGVWVLWLEDGEITRFKNGRSSILEQYTGLKDKNGKEIYEGDIVRYCRHIGGIIPPESHMETVSWWSGEEEYYPCCTTSGFALPYSEDGYEVIGNIHENPELIEKEKE